MYKMKKIIAKKNKNNPIVDILYIYSKLYLNLNLLFNDKINDLIFFS